MNTSYVIRCSLISILLVMGTAACSGSRRLGVQDAPRLAAGTAALQKADEWYRKGCYPKALVHYRRAYPELVAGDHLQEMAICLNNIGNVYLRSGKPESALVFFNEALQIPVAATGTRRQALINKATALIGLKRYDDAGAAITDARTIGSQAGADIAPLLATDALLQIHRGDNDAVRALLAQALTAVGSQDTATKAVIQYTLGHLYRSSGALDTGFTHFEKALEADRRQEYYRGMADDLKAMGDIRAAQRRHRESAGFYKRSIALYALIDAAAEAEALKADLSQMAAASGQTIDATLYFVDDWLGNPSFNGPCE